jgi:predicted nucleic acid-binding protein
MLLDACVVINLYASRYMEDILRATTMTVGIVDAVVREAGHVRKGGAGDDANELDPIELGAMIGAGALRRVNLGDEELDEYVALTQILDDGEAMTVAIALSHGATVATDEKKAVRVIAGRVPVVSSLHMVKRWADAQMLDPVAVARVLGDIRERGRYVPGNRHPLRQWWDANIARS